MKNYGLDIEREQSEIRAEDYVHGQEHAVLGSSLPECITNIPESQRWWSLPIGEVQNGIEDMMDCATRGPHNIIETKLNWLYKEGKIKGKNIKWLRDNGYFNGEKIEISDAFIAILSKTTRTGNSLKSPLDALHEYGFIPKSKLPLLKSMTFDQYHNPNRITAQLKALGAESKRRFPIGYIRVFAQDYDEILTKDLLNVAGYAWSAPVNGEYPRSGNQANHCFIIFKHPKYFAFDNYIDPVDGDYVKKLRPDYAFLNYGYRVIITAQNVPEETDIEDDGEGVETPQWIQAVLNLVRNLTNVWKPA